MVWLTFFAAAAVIVFAATKLSLYGDVIAENTKLGGMFVGMLLIAGATSLPEVATSVAGVYQDAPNIAAGNLLGSNGFNMMLLAVVFLIEARKKTSRAISMNQALMGALAVMLIALVTFLISARLTIKVGWFGLDSIFILVCYVVSVALINRGGAGSAEDEDESTSKSKKVKPAVLRFSLWAVVLIAVTPFMVNSAEQIAIITGLGNTFVGTTLVAMITSLPELTTTLAAIRIGAGEMAVGNLFGSNMFNMFALGLTDVLYIQAPFFPLISDSFVFVGLVGLVMTIFGLIGSMLKSERDQRPTVIASVLMLIFFFLGLALLYQRG